MQPGDPLSVTAVAIGGGEGRCRTDGHPVQPGDPLSVTARWQLEAEKEKVAAGQTVTPSRVRFADRTLYKGQLVGARSRRGARRAKEGVRHLSNFFSFRSAFVANSGRIRRVSAGISSLIL